MFANENGISKDETKAFELYSLSANQGYVHAQCNLG
jgi:TPR repeat protein